ncbi:MAG: D-alanyl-D-alanine carboxypeptidase family protein [Sedimenticolaceae bacterium]|nr:D-alanyl-D-alanine carboxypeptidase family protein [Sedimenticolaceae bacterium]
MIYSKRINGLLFGLLLLVAGTSPALAIDPPDIEASGHLLIDVHTGNVLSEKNADDRLEPASLTKIMTAHLVFMEIEAGRIKLEDLVTISEKAWRMGGSKMFIEVGKQVTVEDLLKGLIIQSGNDAAVALAEYVAGSEEAFAQLMNKEAERLGATGTHFVNSSGMPDPEHYTTPRDIALMSRATILDHPEFYSWYAIKDFTYNDIKQNNRNGLLWKDSSVDGVKTGHTEAAGYCLVASAVRDGTRLMSVVMGTESTAARETASSELLNYGFRFFETRKILSAGAELQQVKVWKGDVEQVPVGVASDIYMTYPRAEKESLQAQLTLSSPIEAPLQKGQQLGSVIISLNGEQKKSVPLVALSAVNEGSFFSRMTDSFMLWLE